VSISQLHRSLAPSAAARASAATVTIFVMAMIAPYTHSLVKAVYASLVTYVIVEGGSAACGYCAEQERGGEPGSGKWQEKDTVDTVAQKAGGNGSARNSEGGGAGVRAERRVWNMTTTPAGSRTKRHIGGNIGALRARVERNRAVARARLLSRGYSKRNGK
jgi:hypothetical protein